jgi:hypothetical protein
MKRWLIGWARSFALHYAMRDGERINIDTLEKQDQAFEHVCLSCGNAMTPVMGSIRAWHFHHKVEADCSGETYFHNLAKLVFYRTYKECLDTGKPYLIQYKSTAVCNYCEEDGPCNVGIVLGDYDLTRHSGCCQSALKIDPPSASKIDPPQAVVFTSLPSF